MTSQRILNINKIAKTVNSLYSVDLTPESTQIKAINDQIFT